MTEQQCRYDSNHYDSLDRVLKAARDQTATGKGKERHAVDNAFEDQIICQIQRILKDHPFGYQAGQAIKKTVEAGRLYKTRGAEVAIAETYGAINYLAAMCIVMGEGEGEAARGCNTCFFNDILQPTPEKCIGCIVKGYENWTPKEVK